MIKVRSKWREEEEEKKVSPCALILKCLLQGSNFLLIIKKIVRECTIGKYIERVIASSLVFSIHVP